MGVGVPPVWAVTWRLATCGISSASEVSSWKWVANRQNALISFAMCLYVRTSAVAVSLRVEIKQKIK